MKPFVFHRLWTDGLATSAAKSLEDFSSAIHWAELSPFKITVAYFVDDGLRDVSHLLAGLSPVEISKVAEIVDIEERRHFVLRRCFQRVFVATVVSWTEALHRLPLRHGLDQQPHSAAAPVLALSFSSSGQTVCACASADHFVGIDVERMRKIHNVDELSARFFTGDEAVALLEIPENRRNVAFLQYWTAKEAALKSIGRGIVSGLNRFCILFVDGNLVIRDTREALNPYAFTFHHPNLLEDHVIAIVHKPRN